MKSIFYSFFVGMVLGGVAVFFIINKSSPVQATMKITSSTPNVKITDQKLTVKNTHKTVQAKAIFTTDKKGTYTNTMHLNKKDLQYKHGIYLETGYWVNSKMPYINVSYSYQNFKFAVHSGYSFELRNIDYGVGVGYLYSF